MGNERDALLATVVDEAAANGLRDRSLRELARATGTSHPRLLYHFGSRQGLVAAVVAHVESAEREVFRELAARTETPAELTRALWRHVSAPERRPLIRLFFEVVGDAAAAGHETAGEGAADAAGGVGAPRVVRAVGAGGARAGIAKAGVAKVGVVGTDPWLDEAERAMRRFAGGYDADVARLGVAVVRGLLVDLLATGDAAAATRALERFVAGWVD